LFILIKPLSLFILSSLTQRAEVDASLQKGSFSKRLRAVGGLAARAAAAAAQPEALDLVRLSCHAILHFGRSDL
jgi:hypothetical protein